MEVHTGLDAQILQSMTLYIHLYLSRDKQLRMFLMGDNEFLCRMYGLTGATGKHVIHIRV